MLTTAFYRLSERAAEAALREVVERLDAADADFPAPAEVLGGPGSLLAWSATRSGTATAGLFRIDGQRWLAIAGRPSRGMVYVPPFGEHYKPLFDLASPAAVLAAALNADPLAVTPVTAADAPAEVRGWALAEAAAAAEYGKTAEITVFPGALDLRAETLRTLGPDHLPASLWAEFMEAAKVAARVDRRRAAERGIRALAAFPGAQVHRALLRARLATIDEYYQPEGGWSADDERPFKMMLTRDEKAAANAAADVEKLPAHLHFEVMRAVGTPAHFAASV